MFHGSLIIRQKHHKYKNENHHHFIDGDERENKFKQLDNDDKKYDWASFLITFQILQCFGDFLRPGC